MSTTQQQTREQPPGADPGVQRGCGRRVEGGVYFETATGPDGIAIENFWCDPPAPWEYETESKVGQEIVQPNEDVPHVVDHIGTSHYAYPCDLLEEVRVHGLSRRVSKNFDFGRLTPDSRIILIHDRAVATSPPACMEHAQDKIAEEADTLEQRDRVFRRHRSRCALFETGSTKHIRNPSEHPCTRHWYLDAPATTGGLTRKVGDTYFQVSTEGDPQIETETGVIASFPIHRLCVIESADGSHSDTRDEIASQSSIPAVVNDA